jgi:mono/diheme cytochrome c family protein
MKIQYPVFMCAILLSQYSYGGSPVEGRTNYDMHCSMCHGMDGVSITPDAADFSRGEGLVNSDMRLVTRIQEGKSICPGFGGILTRQEILDVIAYTRTLFR